VFLSFDGSDEVVKRALGGDAEGLSHESRVDAMREVR
jgi:hypothetical protein